MIINSDFEVDQPVETVWRFFDDVPRVAACLPGAELSQDLGGGRYKGGVAIAMGPVRLKFAGTADIVSRDNASKTIVVHATGADEKGRGNAAMTVTARLSPRGGGTRVDVTQDLALSGAAAQYGRGMIADFSAIMMRDFSATMADRIARPSAAVSGGAAASGRAGGFGLAARAGLLALARVFRRFFLPYQGASA